MARLIEAPDLTSKKQIRKLIEAPNLTGKVIGEGDVSKGDIPSELTAIHRDIAKLNQAIGKTITTVLDTKDTVRDLSKEWRGIVSSVGELNDRIKEVSNRVGTPQLTTDNRVDSLQKTIQKQKKDIDWLLDEVDRINNVRLKEPKTVYMVNEGMTQSQIDKLDEVGSKVPSVVPDSTFKKVTNIYVEPVSGQLVVIHEE